MSRACADGDSEFVVTRDMTTNAREEVGRLNRGPASMGAVPTVLALQPHIEEVYRQQVVDLEAALAVPEAQLEAIPRLRAMIARIVVHPNLQKKRGVVLEVIRQMDEILSIATGTHGIM